MRSPPWTEADIPSLMAMPKVIRHPFPGAVAKPAHPSMRRIHVPVWHADGSMMEGVQAIIEWRANPSPEGCNERYMLFAHVGRDFIPVFRIEAYPAWKRSHSIGKGRHIRGPHIHYRDRVRRASAAFDCGAEHRWRWLDRFLRHIHARMVYDSGDGGLFDPRSLPLF